MVRKYVPWLAAVLVLGACGDETTSGPAAGLAPSFHREGSERDALVFSDWSAPVNVGPPVNTDSAQLSPAVSKDGLSLYFQCFNCPGNVPAPGGGPSPDIWVSRRASVNDPWGPPQNLGSTINTASNEGAPVLSRDGHRLYFTSGRPGGFGGNDLYVSRRRNKRDDFGWQPPENLGSEVNTSFNEAAPEPFEDVLTGTIALFFHSDRPGGLGSTDIYSSTLQSDEIFGAAALVTELSSPARDEGPGIRRDGLEIFLTSNRAGSIPPPPGMPAQVLDLWVATRARTSEPWSTPVNLGTVVNSQFIEAGSALSFDGTTLYFHSPFRPGNVSNQFDLWRTTRSKLFRTVLVDANRSGDGTAKTIQEGIDMVAPGGRVRVAPGAYHEQVTVSKNDITIVADDGDDGDNGDNEDDGPGGVVVDAHGHDFGFHVLNASRVTIEGFRVEGAHEVDILLDGATFTRIRKNVTTDAGHDGIELVASHDNVIEHNVAVDNLAENACGVNVIAGSTRNVVRENRVMNNEWGIQIAGAATLDNVISENKALRNRGNGIRNMAGASGTIIEENVVVENGLAPSPMTTGTTAAGIRIGSGAGIVVRENRVSGNLVVELLQDAAATATFADNQCGTSSPAGLCEGGEDDNGEEEPE